MDWLKKPTGTRWAVERSSPLPSEMPRGGDVQFIVEIEVAGDKDGGSREEIRDRSR